MVHRSRHDNHLLNRARREAELDRMANGEGVDLLVVGLGVTGAGVALDAASRGLWADRLLEGVTLRPSRATSASPTSRWTPYRMCRGRRSGKLTTYLRMAEQA